MDKRGCVCIGPTGPIILFVACLVRSLAKNYDLSVTRIAARMPCQSVSQPIKVALRLSKALS